MSAIMAYLHPTIRARIEAQINTKTAQLAAANASYTAALTNSEIQTYTFDSGEGKQSTTRRKPAEIAAAIRILESEIDRLQRRLDGTSIVNLNLRRRSQWVG
jgi:uncharacterized small protein (DUF1192 family)